jgi:hypothetical protein
MPYCARQFYNSGILAEVPRGSRILAVWLTFSALGTRSSPLGSLFVKAVHFIPSPFENRQSLKFHYDAAFSGLWVRAMSWMSRGTAFAL